MAMLIFYRQVREDGGIRTGIELNGTTVFERFESGGDDHDPALVWYVDIRCEGTNLPQTAEEARDWLQRHGMYVRDGLPVLADKLRAGVDVGSYPLRWQVPNVPEGVRMTVVCSALRRVPGLEIANVLNEIGFRWEELVKDLPCVHTVQS
jgi:hypothetical protein